jgi:hypothetical protein
VASLLKLAVEIYATASVALNIAQALLGELKEMDD